jgi:Ca2+-binding RTX toxin-like protein
MVKGSRNRLSDCFKGSLSSALVAMLGRGRQRKMKTPRRNMCAETCEARVLLSATVLTGTAGNDVFTLTYDSVDTSGEVRVTLSTNGGAATSLGTFSMLTGLSVRGLAGTDSVKVVGTTGADIYTVSGAKIGINGSEIMLAGVEHRILEGRAGQDIYRLDADTPLGRITIDESGGGRDLLDFSLTANVGVKVNLSQATQQHVNSNLQLVLSAGNTIENLIGSARNDVLLGNALDNLLVGGAGNDTLNGGAGSDDLRGGTGNDTYVFGAAAAAETDTVIEAPGGGIDLLTFSAVTSSVRVNLGLTTNQAVHSNRVLRLNASNTIENLTGGQGDDTLVGNVLNNVLQGGPGDDFLSARAGSDTLIGGTGDDTYQFAAAASMEVDTVVEQSAAGRDTLDFSLLSVNVAVNLGTTAIQTVHTLRNLRLSSAMDFENVIGGSGDDTLTGNAADNGFNGGAGNDSMLGRGGNDVYYFTTASSAEVDRITELADGGTDTLSFAALTTNVTVNLGTTATQNIHIKRQLILNSATGLENIIGGAGNDSLTGNSRSNVLVGNAGNDRLVGLQGRDILSGGFGADVLLGGDDEDILIAGRTTSDLNIENLLRLQTQWISSNSYNTRVRNLRDGVGSPTVSLKAKVNILNDGGADDRLTGGSHRDWYFRAIDDVITDLADGETIDVL